MGLGREEERRAAGPHGGGARGLFKPQGDGAACFFEYVGSRLEAKIEAIYLCCPAR